MHPYIPLVFIRSLWNAVSTPRNQKWQSSLSGWTRRPRDRNDGLDRNYTYLLKTNGALKLNRFMVSDHYSESRAVTNWWAVVQWRGMSSQLISRDIIAVVGRTEVHSLCCVGRTVSAARRISQLSAVRELLVYRLVYFRPHKDEGNRPSSSRPMRKPDWS